MRLLLTKGPCHRTKVLGPKVRYAGPPLFFPQKPHFHTPSSHNAHPVLAGWSLVKAAMKCPEVTHKSLKYPTAERMPQPAKDESFARFSNRRRQSAPALLPPRVEIGYTFPPAPSILKERGPDEFRPCQWPSPIQGPSRACCTPARRSNRRPQETYT